ncbi:hypothetical protein E3P89_00799 [Wallemia ichthyophaga]|uniref:ATP-dependent (S)-NAD(P)H-hydrate dehydratase n=1 Tax=Wallemia ichthyophaga TaxID=245174 RepID=A0A4T0I647_WALIC|nr:hypothetical protein E3P93_02225 [Wallemia ichthyophaga]TIB14923.1 hypothetical protein E3P90_01094 [Wallemia ichthyophaga]TIB24760.1 hypothetical protein E3P89_00799 [Wallemia ichthyophaga]TIB26540.1 hypothetical protein E3P88_00963 [Wallemia ichthyophaga]
MSKPIQLARALVPPLSPSLHKGQAGRLGVVGGSKDYTGAPFFCAMSAMRIGVDLAHIICEPKAGDAIKTYAPDLIVHRVLAEDDPIEHIRTAIDDIVARLHVLVVGPGLGRDEHMQACAGAAISAARSRNIPLVIDADGLWYLNNHPESLTGYPNAIITPNVMEMKRLCGVLGIDQGVDALEDGKVAKQVSQKLGGVTVLQKGAVDCITNGRHVLTVDAPGSLKRCGGQGDVLSGATGTMLAWGVVYANGIGSHKKIQVPHQDIELYAAYGAAAFTRECSRRTYADSGRSMITQDMLSHLSGSYEAILSPDNFCVPDGVSSGDLSDSVLEAQFRLIASDPSYDAKVKKKLRAVLQSLYGENPHYSRFKQLYHYCGSGAVIGALNPRKP